MSGENRPTISKKRAKQNHGFTLLEVLVSITVISLLATTILFAWRIATAAWGRATTLLEEDRRVDAVQQVLREQMAAMVPLRSRSNQALGEVFFQGEPLHARFVSRYSLENRTRAGLYRIEYSVERQSDGTMQILLNEFPVENPEELTALLVGTETTDAGSVLRFTPLEHTAQTQVLMDGLPESHLEYFQSDAATGQGTWVTQWTSRGELPRAMAIRIAPTSGTGETASGTGRLHLVSIVSDIPNFAMNVEPLRRR